MSGKFSTFESAESFLSVLTDALSAAWHNKFCLLADNIESEVVTIYKLQEERVK
jgi:hypothetical protein